MFPPERIVCLTEETVETLYLLDEDRRLAVHCCFPVINNGAVPISACSPIPR